MINKNQIDIKENIFNYNFNEIVDENFDDIDYFLDQLSEIDEEWIIQGYTSLFFGTKFKETIKLTECESWEMESWLSYNKMLNFVKKVTNSLEFKSDSIKIRTISLVLPWIRSFSMLAMKRIVEKYQFIANNYANWKWGERSMIWNQLIDRKCLERQEKCAMRLSIIEKSQNKEEINHEYKFLSEPKTDNPVDNIDCI